MDISTRLSDLGPVLVVDSERIDAASVVAFKDLMRDKVASIQTPFLLELKGVTFVDSSGLGAIVAILKFAQASAPVHGIIAPFENVRRVFALTHLDRVVPVYARIEDAGTDEQRGARS